MYVYLSMPMKTGAQGHKQAHLIFQMLQKSLEET